MRSIRSLLASLFGRKRSCTSGLGSSNCPHRFSPWGWWGWGGPQSSLCSFPGTNWQRTIRSWTRCTRNTTGAESQPAPFIRMFSMLCGPHSRQNRPGISAGISNEETRTFSHHILDLYIYRNSRYSNITGDRLYKRHIPNS